MAIWGSTLDGGEKKETVEGCEAGRRWRQKAHLKSLTLKQVMVGTVGAGRVKIMFTFKSRELRLSEGRREKVQEALDFIRKGIHFAQLNQVCKNIWVRLIRQA